jgi:hypothetical protein
MHYRRWRRAKTRTRPNHRPPQREYEWDKAVAFLLDGASYREVEHTLKIPRSTLRDNLPGMGWTSQEGGQFKGFLASDPKIQKFFYKNLFDNARRTF